MSESSKSRKALVLPMITTQEQEAILDQVRAMTHGMSADEKKKVQEQLLAGIVIALDVQHKCPAPWKALLMIGRAHKLFGKRPV